MLQARRLWIGRRQECSRGAGKGSSGAGTGAWGHGRERNGHFMGRIWPPKTRFAAPPEVRLHAHHTIRPRVTAFQGPLPTRPKLPMDPIPMPIIGHLPRGPCPLNAMSGKGNAHLVAFSQDPMPIRRALGGRPCRGSGSVMSAKGQNERSRPRPSPSLAVTRRLLQSDDFLRQGATVYPHHGQEGTRAGVASLGIAAVPFQ